VFLEDYFLRKEEPGRLYQGGDLDNRLKTLFDALSVPNKEQVVDDPTMVEQVYCLLEDDRLITKVDIDTPPSFAARSNEARRSIDN
jgi:hypothetical protein